MNYRNLSKCIVALLKEKYRGGHETKYRNICDKPKNAKMPVGLRPTKGGHELSTISRYLHDHFDQALGIDIPRAIYQRII